MHRSDREETRLLVCFLRTLAGWSRPEAAEAAGVHSSTISRYQNGGLTPAPAVLEQLAAAAGVSLEDIRSTLLPAFREILAGRGSVSNEDMKDLGEASTALEQFLRTEMRAAFAACLSRPVREPGQGQCSRAVLVPEAVSTRWVEDRRRVPRLWAQLAECSASERRVLIRHEPEFQSWALSERLAHESERRAAYDAGEACALASLAVQVAELAAGPPALRSRTRGYATFFLGNAQRVAGRDLEGAEASFREAWRLWREGEAFSSLFAEWRPLDLEASLRRALRQWPRALDLLERALALAPAGAAGHILLIRAVTFEQMGDFDRAVATLEEAAPLVDGSGDPRLPWVLRFNFATNLCHLGRHSDAEAHLPELARLAAELDNRLDQLRVRWLAGRVAEGLGRRDEALAALEEVRVAFSSLGNAYNTALVSLELAAFHLEAGRSAEVLKLAEEMLWIFGSNGIHREALAALRLFHQAAQQRTMTAALARQLLADLECASRELVPGS